MPAQGGGQQVALWRFSSITPQADKHVFMFSKVKTFQELFGNGLYQCDIIAYACVRMYVLSHIKIYTSERPYLCLTC